MTAPSCPECTAALQRVVHQHYDETCPDCGVRRLAYMPLEERRQALDRVQFVMGYEVRLKIEKRVHAERDRIAALSAAMPRKEKAT